MKKAFFIEGYAWQFLMNKTTATRNFRFFFFLSRLNFLLWEKVEFSVNLEYRRANFLLGDNQCLLH